MSYFEFVNNIIDNKILYFTYKRTYEVKILILNENKIKKFYWNIINN